MPRQTTSEAVMSILDGIIANYGDIVLGADDAEQIFGGKAEVKVSDLSQHALLQYALLHAHIQINALIANIEAATKPNRAQRRQQKKLHLPS